jgi:putative Mg2+ transporter-C (MgtC) family protein
MISEAFTLNLNEVMGFAIKVGLPTLAGLIIGLEREYKGKSAGLKTNTLVGYWFSGIYIDFLKI